MREDDFIGETDIGSILKQEQKRKEVAQQQMKLSERAQQKKREKVDSALQENKYAQFFKKNSLVFLIIFLILATIIPHLYYASFPITQEWAYGIAERDIKGKITYEIETRYSTLSDHKKKELIEQLVKKEIKKPETKAEINKLAKQLQENFKDPSGSMYLYEVDPYYYYNLIQTQDFSEPKPGLVYLGYWSHKLFQWLFNTESLFTSLIYLPLLFTVAATVALFFLIRIITNTTAGFFGALFFTLNPYVISQTAIGFFDRQSINVFFCVILTLFLIIIFKETHQRRWVSVACSALGFMTTAFLFSTVWSGHYIFYVFLLSGGFLYTLIWALNKLKKEKFQKVNVLLTVTVILGILFLLLVVFKTNIQKIEPSIVKENLSFLPAETKDTLTGLISVIKTYVGLDSSTTYPNGYSYIEELQALSLKDVSKIIGGIIPTLFLVLGLLLLYGCLSKLESREEKTTALGMCILFVWFITLTYLVLNSKRFLIFFLIPASFFLGYGFFTVYSKFKNLIDEYVPVSSVLIVGITRLLLIVLLIFPIALVFTPQYELQKALLPIVDDSVYQAALIIKEQAPENAKIVSWWDKGHIVNALTQRTTIARGAPENIKSYWTAKALVETNEQTSRNIFQALGCNIVNGDGGIRVWYGGKISHEEATTNQVLNNYFSAANSQEKERYLRRVLEEADVPPNNHNSSIQVFTSQTSCNTSQPYIFLTEDQIAVFSGLVLTADWDFEAEEVKQLTEGLKYTEAIEKLMQNMNLTQNTAQDLYFKSQNANVIKGIGLRRSQCLANDELIQCTIADEHTFLVNKTNGDVLSKKKPKRVIISENDNIVEKTYEDGQYDYENTLLIYNTDDPYFSFLLEHRIADSMFIRMLFLEGKGLEHFEQVVDVHKFGTKRTVVYTVKSE